VRVLTITNYFPPDHVGGAEIAALMTCQGLARRGTQVHVAVLNTRLPQELDRYYEWEGIPIHQVNYRTPRRRHLTDVFDWRIYWQALQEIGRVRPDVIHIHNVSGTSLAPFVAARRAGIPVVATLHDHWLLCPNNMLYRADGVFCDPAQDADDCAQCFRRYDFWGAIPRRRRILAALVSRVHTFISPSQSLVDLHVRGGYDRLRFRVIRNGISAALPEKFQHWGVCKIVNKVNGPTLVYAGGGVQVKGIETLSSALPTLIRYIERLQVVIAGGGESYYLRALRRYMPAVQVLGRVPYTDMPALYASADLTLVPSEWLENSPVVIQQSLLLGTPVVGSAVGGISELIRDGETGYLIPRRDPAALAEAVILHLARAPVERRAMRRRCAGDAARTLDYEQHLDAVSEVYRQAIGHA